MMEDGDVGRFYNALKDPNLATTETLVRELVNAKISPVEILNQGLIGGMAIIGREFKAGQVWVPEVLLAARNMNLGIEILKPQLLKEKVESKGKIVIGTVKGDIHDIGKNLVTMMMTGAGYEVIDLGTDVPQEKFIDALSETNPDLVGLSALLTTTMMEMKGIIQTIRDAFPIPPMVLVGGAPVTRAFAVEIGADGYAEDAVRAVEVANRIVSGGKR